MPSSAASWTDVARVTLGRMSLVSDGVAIVPPLTRATHELAASLTLCRSLRRMGMSWPFCFASRRARRPL